MQRKWPRGREGIRPPPGAPGVGNRAGKRDRAERSYATAEGQDRDRLREAEQAYSLRYDFGYDGQEDAGRYAAERQRYVESELPEYEARAARQRGLAEQELVENFIHRVREQIEDARSQLDHLNTTLSKLRFGGERYEFIASPAPDLRRLRHGDGQPDGAGRPSSTPISAGPTRKAGTCSSSAHHRRGRRAGEELRRLQDYRNYLAYDIRIHYPNGDRVLHSQISAKKSGGETTTPFYVAMAASFAQAYRLNQARPSDTIRLALFDEAFGKMDTARTAIALKFMVDAGLQVLLATPPDKAGGSCPTWTASAPSSARITIRSCWRLTSGRWRSNVKRDRCLVLRITSTVG